MPQTVCETPEAFQVVNNALHARQGSPAPLFCGWILPWKNGDECGKRYEYESDMNRVRFKQWIRHLNDLMCFFSKSWLHHFLVPVFHGFSGSPGGYFSWNPWRMRHLQVSTSIQRFWGDCWPLGRAEPLKIRWSCPRVDGLPSGYVKIAIENHHFQWVNPL